MDIVKLTDVAQQRQFIILVKLCLKVFENLHWLHLVDYNRGCSISGESLSFKNLTLDLYKLKPKYKSIVSSLATAVAGGFKLKYLCITSTVT